MFIYYFFSCLLELGGITLSTLNVIINSSTQVQSPRSRRAPLGVKARRRVTLGVDDRWVAPRKEGWCPVRTDVCPGRAVEGGAATLSVLWPHAGAGSPQPTTPSHPPLGKAARPSARPLPKSTGFVHCAFSQQRQDLCPPHA